MNFSIRILGSMFLALSLTACVSTLNRPEEPVDSQVRGIMEAKVSEAESAMDVQNYSLAIELFSKFERDYPNSMFLYRAKIGHGRALTEESKYTEALKYFREVSDAALGRKPEFVALSSYYSSYCFEALGEENKTFASLQDAKNLAEKLPPEVAQAELPARLAAYYNRAGDTENARKFYRQAEQGIAVVFHGETEKEKTAKARTFYYMGHLVTDQTTMENMQRQMDSLAMMQIFLLRSIEANDSKWSPEALKSLQANYRDLWNSIMQIPRNKALDAFAAEQEQREAQSRSVGQILDLIQKLRVYQIPAEESGNAVNKSMKELLAFLTQLEGHAQQVLNSGGSLPLTPEAQQRQSLRRDGTVREEPQQMTKAPVEPPKQKPIADPNL